MKYRNIFSGFLFIATAISAPAGVATLRITGSAIDENGAESVEMLYIGDAEESGQVRDFLLADPTVYTENGRYYAAGTRSFEPKGFTLLESTDLHNWSYARPDSLVLREGRGCWGSTGFWAPHFFKNGDRDYLISYVANERCCIARAETIDGDYTQTAVEPVDNSEGNIDPFIFRDDDGRYYMYHVRFPAGNILHVCELDPETWKIIPGTLKECFRNTQHWENTGAYPGLVMEGPSVIKLDGLYYMFYSANHYMSPDYAVGYATASSPAGPWTKYEGNPILHRSIVGEKGSGHGEVFFDNDGNMRYMYHVHNSDTQVNPRRTRIVTFNVDKSAGHPYRISADPASVFTPSMQAREGLFSCYVRLREGSYTFTGTDSDGNAMSLDGMEGICGKAGVYRVTADARNRKVSLTPVGDLLVRGTMAAGIALPYIGKGIFGGEITLTGKDDTEYSRKNIYFSLGDGTDYYRTAGTDRLSVAGEAIRINAGTYNVRIDLNECTFDISAETDPYRISVFGSSVANGQGADNFRGYAYLYGNQLKTRTSKGDSEYPLYTSGVSIGGNTTVNLLGRYDDLIRDHGKYVVFGLSLGNEGIHGSTEPSKVFNQFRDNMLTLIEKVRADGKVPVVMNNYTRIDYNTTDYNYVRRMNLLIHEWDVPSVNALGAVDDRSGRWASSFRKDDFHPNGQGHKQMMYTIPPSLFDALESGKALTMERAADSHELQLTNGASLSFTPEETLNAFTVSVHVKVSGACSVLSFKNGSRGNQTGRLESDANGKLTYTTPSGTVVPSEIGNLDDGYHYVTLTHYFGAGCTILYIDKGIAFVTKESLSPKTFTIGNKENAAGSLAVSEVSFWRSAMNSMEIDAHCAGKLLKSSLEIYSPAVLPDAQADENGTVVCGIPNLAMSLNAITYEGPVQSGIAPVIDCSTAAVPLGYYTIDGRPAAAETPGFIIVHYSDGTCCKRYRR